MILQQKYMTIKKKIIFKIKRLYYPKLLTPETLKLLGSTKSKITKNGNCENVPLEISELVSTHGSFVNNGY